MALLEVAGLQVSVDVEGVAVRALDGIGFSLEAGEVLGIVGESGSGKSMTALAIQRLLPAACRITAGSMRFDGTELLSLPEEKMRRIRGARIAQIFQDPLSALNPIVKVGKQIGEVLRIHQPLARTAVRERVIEGLAKVGIPNPQHRYDQYPHELSGGMRQRVMIAMALACRPQLLIADEPTTALDVTIQAQILDLLRSLQREYRMATIFITHDLGVVSQFADRLAVMYAGKIVEQGPTREVLARPAHPYTQALLLSIPALNPGAPRLPVIPGTVPRLSELPSGCRFRSRCDSARDACARMPGGFSVPVALGHASACIRNVGYRLDGE